MFGYLGTKRKLQRQVESSRQLNGDRVEGKFRLIVIELEAHWLGSWRVIERSSRDIAERSNEDCADKRVSLVVLYFISAFSEPPPRGDWI